ncbi:hypothetical protein [Variovorax arabinosiphilus]|uniref:hypothetical protein n=1 Tax=Variovorax arabinosiphilus TaxID=3053498 RepID=UPI002577D7B0|nr:MULTISPECIES: hypothetical protein [unclassified Variovorax]MDM0118852.1 hypothetical protein [Variovorax sp. J2L1-78]MDM0129277.1 hypothetical protein [Variovorax sp. J2L1-63]MDM0232936.1 hypothetical protein [Variovorax sp. J2R1-6]
MQIAATAKTTAAPMNPIASLNRATRFFWDHAQSCPRLDQDPAEARLEYAEVLADAESHFLDAESRMGFTFHVRANRKTTRPRTWTMWIAQADGQAVAWLTDVQDGSPAACRVVRAELAIDAKEAMEEAALGATVH